MPKITVHTPLALDGQKKEALRARCGNLVTILPGKEESGLMLELVGGQAMYLRGAACNCAFVEVRLYKESPFDAKRAFALALFEALEEILGVKREDIYLNYMEFENWGSRGDFR